MGVIMECNVGAIDKLIRVIIGIGIIVTGVALKNFIGIVGLIPLITGLTGRCPIYYALGIATKKHEASNAE